MFNDQTAKKDMGKLQLSLCPMELLEVVAVVRMYGNAKYPQGGVDNWKQVSVDRYVNAAFRHFANYIREHYGRDTESNLPHLYHLACNVSFLLWLEMEKGTIPRPEEALKQMHYPDPVGAARSEFIPQDGYLYANELKMPPKGAQGA